MKKVILLALLFSISFALAEPCNPEVTMLNQDPYPAVPGDYVKLVFQIEGLENPECGDIIFELLEDYPIKFDPNENGIRSFKKVDYIKDYESNILIPFEVRLDENALDGASPVEFSIKNLGKSRVSKTFDLEVEDARADFEIYIKDYDYSTKELTIEVLNIENSDVEALTIEIPKQDGVEVKGSNRIVVGDLDSNEYTTADFEATIQDGEIQLNLIYSDSINVRRTLEKTVQFDSSYFVGRASDAQSNGIGGYVVLAVIALIIILLIVRRHKKKCKKKS